MKTIIFWGAGKIGKYMLELWQQFGVQPGFFADNTEAYWGTCYYGIKVLSMEELKRMEDIYVLITCKQVDEISAQISDYGINEQNIFKGNTVIDMVSFLISHMSGKLRLDIAQDEGENREENSAYKVLFDVHQGFVLGGVEAWALQMAEELAAQGIRAKFIVLNRFDWSNNEDDDRIIQVEHWEELSKLSTYLKILKEIRKYTPCNIVCNFPFYTYIAACMAKALWPQEINLIAVVHNDEEIYYSRYNQMQAAIDHCLVTCDAMEERFIQGGMPKEKIGRIAWKIPCEDTLSRTYSEAGQPIRIGYAGRIVVHQKRMDLLIEIIKRLQEADVDFQLELAGSGEYEEEMKEILSDFSDKIQFKGCLPREQLAEFWKHQDIGINCSDFEGRCISKAESMAAGAVPVITDTSSARDDVQDGYHGFVVPVGDAEKMVEKICYLYHHREQIEVMGRRSHEFIKKANEENNVLHMWNKILKF